MKQKRLVVALLYLVLAGVAIKTYPYISALFGADDADSSSAKTNATASAFCNGKPCNVILIVSDTLSAEHMSVYGYGRDTTPFLKQITSERGLLFSNSVSSGSWTPPSMIALFFSRAPHKMGFKDIFTADSNFLSVLKKQQIDSVGFLKQIQVKNKDINPFVVFAVVNNFEKPDVERYLSDYGTNEKGFTDALAWLKKRNSDKPYFMFIHDTTAHDPYDPPLAYRSAFPEQGAAITYPFAFGSPTSTLKLSEQEGQKARLAYDQEVLYLDAQLKEFVSGLGDLSNTIVILTSDHGETFGEIDGHGQHGRPNQVDEAYAHNSVTHVPLVLFGGSIQKGRNDCLVSTVDIAPTILALLSAAVPAEYEGKDFLKSTCQHDIVYSEQTLIPQELIPIFMSYKSVDEKVLFTHNFFEHSTSSIITARNEKFKVIDGDGLLKVFDLSKDPKEERDISQELDSLSEDEKNQVNQIREFIKTKRTE